MRARHSSHWGAFTAIMDNGRLTSVEPFEKDGHSSDLLQSIPDAVYDRMDGAAMPLFRSPGEKPSIWLPANSSW